MRRHLPDRRSLSDEDVLVASVTDPASFAALVDTYGEVIYRYLARRVGINFAEDLAAETFLRAFRGRGGYRPINQTALPWLYGIATNLIRDHAGAEQRRLEVLAAAATLSLSDDRQARVEEALDAATLLPRVAKAIRELPDDARDVIVLIAVEGLSYKQAAEALGVAVGTIRSRLARARAQLRRDLDGNVQTDLMVDAGEGTCEKGVSDG